MHAVMSKLVDILAYRTRLSFLNCRAAQKVVPKLLEIMKKELKWDTSRFNLEVVGANQFLNSMGLTVHEADSKVVFCNK